MRYYFRSYTILKKCLFPFSSSFYPPIPVGFFFSSVHLFWISSYALFKVHFRSFWSLKTLFLSFLRESMGSWFIYTMTIDFRGRFFGCYLALNNMNIDILAVWCQGHFNQLLFVSVLSLALTLLLFWSCLKSANSGSNCVLCCSILCFWFIIYHWVPVNWIIFAIACHWEDYTEEE